MNHKAEAEKLLYLAYNDLSGSEGFFEAQAALAEATLALVEAQEAANELKRIDTVVKILQFAINNDFENADWAITAAQLIVNEKDHKLKPGVARALGIEVAE